MGWMPTYGRMHKGYAVNQYSAVLFGPAESVNYAPLPHCKELIWLDSSHLRPVFLINQQDTGFNNFWRSIPQVKLCFKDIFISKAEWHKAKEQTQRSSTCWFTSPDCHSSQHWIRIEPEGQHSTAASHMSGRNPHSWAVIPYSPSPWPRIWSGSEE